MNAAPCSCAGGAVGGHDLDCSYRWRDGKQERTVGPVPRPPPGISLADAERTMDLYRELARAAIAWGLADRIHEQHAGTLADVMHAIEANPDLAVEGSQLIIQRAQYTSALSTARQRVKETDEALHAMAKRLIAELEGTKR